MDNRHCLNTIGKKDEIERIYLLVKIRTKFGKKMASSVLLKIQILYCIYAYIDMF